MNNDNITQAAANKAAEEDRLRKFDVPMDNALNEAGWIFVGAHQDLMGRNPEAFNHIKPMLKLAIEAWLSHPESPIKTIAADRASRQVANKADVEPVQPQSVSDERKAFDAYWTSLSGEGATEAELDVAEHAAWWAWQARPRHCLALPLSAYPKGATYATPPATTGASTPMPPEIAAALGLSKSASIEEAVTSIRAVQRNAFLAPVGASTVLTDERIEELEAALEASMNREIELEHRIHVLDHMLSGAAQAGQVAVPEGFTIVPLEPTDAMMDAPEVKVGGCYSCSPEQVGWHDCAEIYRSMVAAAPSPAKESK